MPDRLHLGREHRQQLETLLRQCLPNVEVWAYGSRINGRSHEGSDLDLVLRSPNLSPIAQGERAVLDDALQDSTIPFLVEARDWADLPKSFQREIEGDYVLLIG